MNYEDIILLFCFGSTHGVLTEINMLLKTIFTVYFFKDATASVKMNNKSPFNKKIFWDVTIYFILYYVHESGALISV